MLSLFLRQNPNPNLDKRDPEYDDVADDVLCEKLRILFFPEMSYADYSYASEQSHG
jgi:hypothetical protein